jgi:hypothetical protein
MKEVVVFTLVHDQPEFQKIWIEYYSQFNFHLIMLEHVLNEKEVGIVQEDGYERRKIFREDFFDFKWMSETTCAFQRQLLEEYETVIYTDIDELIVPSPSNGTLEEYCKNNTRDITQCKGWELVDREYLIRTKHASKPLVTKVPTTWCYGWHRCEEPYERDPGLWLIHLHRMDYELAKKDWESRQFLKWNKDTEENGLAWQDHFDTEAEFREWYYVDEPNRVDIPQWLKDKLEVVFKKGSEHE